MEGHLGAGEGRSQFPRGPWGPVCGTTQALNHDDRIGLGGVASPRAEGQSRSWEMTGASSQASETLPCSRAVGATSLLWQPVCPGSCVVTPTRSGRSMFKSHRDICWHWSALGQARAAGDAWVSPLRPRASGSLGTSHSFQANLVAAFEQSLVNMTSRLRHLAETAEEKVRGWARGVLRERLCTGRPPLPERPSASCSLPSRHPEFSTCP